MMGRLTGRNEHGGIISTITGVHPDVERMRLLQALAAYEDIGLSPMEIRYILQCCKRGLGFPPESLVPDDGVTEEDLED